MGVCLCRLALHDKGEHEPLSEAELFNGYRYTPTPIAQAALEAQDGLDVRVDRDPAEILERLAELEHQLEIAGR